MKQIATPILAFLFAFTLAEPVAAEWYDGGNLHNANLESWSESTGQNRLATSADIAAKTLDGRISSMNELKIHARNLQICIDEVAIDPQLGSQRVSEIAAGCMYRLGWPTPN